MNFTTRQLKRYFDASYSRAWRIGIIEAIKNMSFSERLARRPSRDLLEVKSIDRRFRARDEAKFKDEHPKKGVTIYNYLLDDDDEVD